MINKNRVFWGFFFLFFVLFTGCRFQFLVGIYLIKRVYLAAIHEFPEDIFTKEQRKNGAVCLHALCVSISCNVASNLHIFLSIYNPES